MPEHEFEWGGKWPGICGRCGGDHKPAARPAKLSPTMQGVVDRMKATGTPLYRWPGGWWTTRGTKARASDPRIPEWECGTTTVRALEERGYVRRAKVAARWWQDDFILVDAVQEVR